MNKKMKFEVLPSPVKSESDKKEYRVIKLENGLTACLIVDTAPSSKSKQNENDEKMAAAALCVGVGSYSDPKNIPGMAHFLEHMVFMGSEKYPGENDFDSFIKKGGGIDNAYTDTEVTCFYFQSQENKLYESLDKFAQFFIAPLMKKSAMTREREAVESEFQMNLPSDSSRINQLFLSLAHPDSRVNTFTYGNLATLRDHISDDKLYEEVHAFRRRHYSAHRMTVAIQARLPMETLQDYVLDCFSAIPNNKLPPLDLKQYENRVFNTPEFNKIYYVKPMKDVCQVELTWALPSLLRYYKSKPHEYVTFLLADEGKGSLLSYLKKKVWVLSTKVGIGASGSDRNSMFTPFSVSMALTQDGLEHLFEVIEVVYAYINMVKTKGPQERIYNEMKSITETSFRYSTEEQADDYVSAFAQIMQTYSSEHYITGPSLYLEYDPEGIKMVTNSLTPDKMNIFVQTNKLPAGKKFDKTEKWFGTQYTVVDIPSEWLSRWKNVKSLPELNLPPPNPYLTTDFSILPDIDNNPDYPQKIMESPLVELWYRKDQKFKMPTGLYNFYLINPRAVDTPSNYCMLDMFINLLSIEISEDAYPAAYADLSFAISSLEKGIVIKVSGYNQKLPVLIELITKHLLTFTSNVTSKMFDAIKDRLVKAYYNKLLKPSNLAKDMRFNLLINKYWTPAEKYSAMLKLSFEAMKKFAADFISHLYVKVLVQGNISQDVAIKTVNTFVSNMKYDPLLENKYSKFRVVQIPIGERCCRVQSFNKKDSNSIITNYYQSGPVTLKTNAILEIIMMIIEEPLFDMLRTKEQLGYDVSCSAIETAGILAYSVSVNAQATKFTTKHVDERIEAFLEQSKIILNETTEEQLNLIKSNIIKLKRSVDLDLSEEMERNWTEIVNSDYLFDRLQKEINAIDSVSLEEMTNWWIEHNKFGSKTNFRKITFQVVGYNIKEKVSDEETSDKEMAAGETPLMEASLQLLGSEKEETRPQNYFIHNIEVFKKGLFIYPVVTRNA